MWVELEVLQHFPSQFSNVPIDYGGSSSILLVDFIYM